MELSYPKTVKDCHELIKHLAKENRMLKEAYSEIMNSGIARNKVINDAHLGEICLDANSVIINANEGFEMLLGYSKGELCGLTFYDILAERHEIHTAIFPIFKKTGVVKNLKWKMKTKQGKHVLVTLCARVIYDENNEFKVAVGIISDITELVTTSEALKTVEREKALVMDVMKDCIVYYDTDQKVIWGNKMIAELTGIPRDKLAGMKCYELCHKASGYCKGCPLGDPLNTKEPKSGEVRAGEMIFYIMTYPVINDNGEYTGLVQIIRNITEQKMLEREVLEISSKERKKIGNDLHDGLGQILTGISFMSSALLKDLGDPNSSAVAIVKNIEKQSKKAIGMMQDILTGLCPVTEDPDGLMTALENLASLITSIYHINCVYNCCQNVQVEDYEMSNNLYLIAREAVTNSIKHSGCTKITLCLDLQDDYLILRINDNGRGFPEGLEEVKGLGLRSMKYRVSVIGGNIEFDSRANVGTTITVTTLNQ